MSEQAKINQISERLNPAAINHLPEASPADGAVVARNAFGQKLLEIRNRAIKKGMRLKSLDEVLADIAEARKEF